MTLNIDLKKILRSFDSIKKELQTTFQNPQILTAKEAQNQLSVREIQLQTVLEISEKLISQFNSASAKEKPDHNPEHEDLKQKFKELKDRFEISEESLKLYRDENSMLKSENQKLSKNLGSNNLFSVEVYQSEIEDLKKEYNEKLGEVQSKIQIEKIEKLEMTNSHKHFIDLQNKYLLVKDQILSYKRKIEELEDIIDKNNDHKVLTEKKYSDLINTQKKMFNYIEKLEVKMKKFHDKHNRSWNHLSGVASRDNSFNLSSRITDEPRSVFLTVVGPIMVFQYR